MNYSLNFYFSYFLLLLFLLVSCSFEKKKDFTRYGKLAPYSSSNKDSFIFTVSDEFLNQNKNSSLDKNHNKMTEAEVDLLVLFLEDKKYCLTNNKLSFVIKSRQEKVYDMTFAHLIEKNYNARPVVPRTYYGECKQK
jgi:hypothetical protein